MNYAEAAGIRKQGLMNQITERLLDDQGIGESFGKSISSVTRAKMMGLREKFDPVNIARFATGGSNLATVLVGRMLGKSTEDINYFANKGKVSGKNKNKNPLFLYTVNQNIQNTRVGDTYADVLGKLYTLFKKNDDEEIILSELMKNFQEEHDMENRRRSREITEALKKVSGKKQKPKEVVRQPQVEPTSEKTTPEPEPKKPRTLTEKVFSVASKTYSFVKKYAPAIAVGGVALGVASDVKAKIGRAEGDSAYNIMNIAPGETKKQSTFDLENMSINDLLSFQQARGQKYGGRGIGKAAGKYQMMPAFIQSYAPQALGPNWKNEKFSRDNQEKIMDLALQNYAKQLTKANIPVNDATLYMVHFSGSTKLAKAIMESPDNTRMESLMTPLQASQNKSVANLTVGQYKKRLGGLGFNFSDNSSGQTIDSLSTENRDSKGLLGRTTSAIIAAKNQLVQIVNNSTTVLGNQPQQDDPELIKKTRGE